MAGGQAPGAQSSPQVEKNEGHRKTDHSHGRNKGALEALTVNGASWSRTQHGVLKCARQPLSREKTSRLPYLERRAGFNVQAHPLGQLT